MSVYEDVACDQVTRAVAVSTAAASLLYSGNAMAAQEMVSQIAESDNRLGVILTLFVPALGWVGFNMLQPLLNQVRISFKSHHLTFHTSAINHFHSCV